MKRLLFLAVLSGLVLLAASHDPAMGGRGRGGGGGGRGGGIGGGGRVISGGGARPVGGGVVHSYGGGSIGARTTTPIVGPGGGSGTAGRGGGSYTTKGGSTIDYKGAGIGGTTGGGVKVGKGVGGIQVTTPGGRELSKVGTGGAAVGPGGKAIGGKSGVAIGSGPQGSIGTKYKGGVAIGPQGGVAGGSKVGIASGPGGVAVGGSRGGIAANPYGAVAGRGTAVAGRGTYYRSTAVIGNQGAYVRRGVAHYPCFRPGWYTRHPGAWFAAGWAAGAVWRSATWDNCYSFCGYSEEPAYYNYGDNVTYQDDGVYFNGEKVYSEEEYAAEATSLADAGREAKTSKDEEWLPLGVFAMVQGDEKTSNHIFQLAINKKNVIRGNYYDAVTDTTSVIVGSVNPRTHRAAWTVGDRKTPVYEAGIANLTKNETTMLVHYGPERSQQFTLIRIEEPDGEEPKAEGPKAEEPGKK